MNQQTPTLDPAFVIGWHVGKAAADRALAAELATDLDLARYGGMQMAADEIRALTAGLWDR